MCSHVCVSTRVYVCEFVVYLCMWACARSIHLSFLELVLFSAAVGYVHIDLSFSWLLINS